MRSNAGMTAASPPDAPHAPLPSDDDPVSRRLADLEVKLAFADDLLEHLNRQVAEQQRQIQMLVQEVLRQRDQLAEGQPVAFRSLRDELPPHY